MGWVVALLGFLAKVAQLFTGKQKADAQDQLLKAGAAQQEVKAQQEVEQHVQEAHDALAIPDLPRTERLRKRFDRSQSTGNE